MIIFDDAVKGNIKEHNPNWSQIPDCPYKILIIWGSESGKTNSLFNLINQNQICFYAKDPYQAKYQFLIIKTEKTSVKDFNDSKVFITYLNNIVYIYKDIQDYNPNTKQKMLIVFDDMVADILTNKKTYSKNNWIAY